MQLELTLDAPPGADYPASDLGYLLHKHPRRLHQRSVSGGTARVFFTEASERRAHAVLALDIDAVGLARRRGSRGDAPLAQYVSDRAFVANSFLSAALSKLYAQSMGGRSKERQSLAERALPLTARVTPVASNDGAATARTLFAPLGYRIETTPIARTAEREVFTLTLSAETRLGTLLRHLHVLVPVLDDAKHWWVDADEIEALLAKGGDWLAEHPARALIARRALKRRRSLADELLERLEAGTGGASATTAPAGDGTGGAASGRVAPDTAGTTDGIDAARAADDTVTDPLAPVGHDARESTLERPLGLHEVRLDRVADVLRAADVSSVLDLGCGEGKLLERLLRDGQFRRLLGVDPSLHALARAAERLHLDEAGEARRARLSLAPGSLSYADRTWRGFDAIVMVEVIEHVDPERHAALELIVFGDARPALVVVTTPNRDYNARFDRLDAGAVRHPDHRFEWSREEFLRWGTRVAEAHGYALLVEPIGEVDPALGAPSQMASFTRRESGAGGDEPLDATSGAVGTGVTVPEVNR